MSSSGKRNWIVQDEHGRVKGPFSTRALLQKITEGKVSESHHVARYPGGAWQVISKNPEFYDHLLRTLENEMSPSSTDIFPSTH